MVATYMDLRGKILRALARASERCFDFFTGAETRIRYRAPVPGDAEEYAPILATRLRKAIRQARPGPEDSFLDIGCGKGRGLIVASEFPYAKLEGVELRFELAAKCRRNLRLLGLEARSCVITGDAGQATVPNHATHILLFNPFGPKSLIKFIECLRASLVSQPRAMKVIYFAPVHAMELEHALGVEFTRLESQADYVIWSNTHETRPLSLPVRPRLLAAASFVSTTALAGAATFPFGRAFPLQGADFSLLLAYALSLPTLPSKLSLSHLATAWPVLLLSVWSVVSAIANHGNISSFGAAGSPILYAAAALAFSSRPCGLFTTLRVWCVSAVALGGIAFLGSALSLIGAQISWGGMGGALGLSFRLKGISLTSNLLASYCLPPTLFLFSAAGGRLFPKRIRRSMFFFLVAVIVSTISRSLVALIFGMFLASKHRRFGRRFVELITLLLIILASVRFEVALPNGTLAPAFSEGARWRIWKSAVHTVAKYPLWGVGPASTVAEISSYPDPDVAASRWKAHNTPLDMAATLGVAGIFFYIMFVAGAMATFLQSRSRSRSPRRLTAALSLAMLAMAFDSLTIDIEHFRHLWVLAGLYLAARLAEAKRRWC